MFREFPRTAVALALLLGTVALAGCAGETPITERPNVLLIVMDTTRADYLSAYGFERSTTPELEGLAAEGVRFDRAFATDFWTLPSHASLFTGRYPSEVGAVSENRFLSDSATTIAEELLEVGYRTRAASRNAWISGMNGFAQGFEVFEECWSTGCIPTQKAKAWINEFSAGEDPFFIFLNLNAAHLPYEPPQRFREQFLDPTAEPERVQRAMRVKGPWLYLCGLFELDQIDLAILRDLYAGELKLMDTMIGQVFAALRTAGELDNTVIIVTSDHGENIGDHGKIDHLLSMYDTTLRIPLILRYPSGDCGRPGSVRDDLLSIMDIQTTLRHLTGLADSEVERRSVCSPRWVPRPFVIAENGIPVNGLEVVKNNCPEFDRSTIDDPLRAIRTEGHKLVWQVGSHTELYDLEADPAEEIDLSRAQPEVRDRLLAQLQDWESSLERPKAEQLHDLDEETLEHLRSMGYVD